MPSSGVKEYQPTLYLICGKIAAGKSTLAKALATRPRTIVVAEDAWISALYPGEILNLEDFFRCSTRVRAAMKPHVIELLKSGQSVVMDFAANTLRQRVFLKEIVEAAGVAHKLHYLDVPDDVCIERLRARNAAGTHPFQVSEDEFEQVTTHFVAPSGEEGFDIVTHKAS